MKRLIILFLFLGCQPQPYFGEPIPVWSPEYVTTYNEPYNSGDPDFNELEGVQCPIPMDCRVFNKTGMQCVYASLECLGRWAECKQLMEPPLTSQSDCKGGSNPSRAADRLTKYGVKRFENSYQDRKAGLDLIKKAMKEGRGALFGVPRHAMVIVHYDEEADVAKIIDNSDRNLKIQTWTAEKFRSRWDSWVMVIYADPDLFPGKGQKDLANQIPIVDRNNPQGEYPKGYVPTPQ